MKQRPGIAETAMRSSGFLPRLMAGVLLVNLCVAALAWWSVQQNFRIHHEQAELGTQNLARALESDIAGTIGADEMALLAVLDEYRRQRAYGKVNAAGLNAYIEQVRTRRPEIDAIRITDAQGVLRYGTGVKPEERQSLADRPHFIRLRDDPAAGLVLSKPQISRVNNKWVIALAHRIVKPDGAFDGMVFAAIPLAHLSRTFSTLDIGSQGMVVLRDADLELVARYPESGLDKLAVGSKVPSPEMHRLIAAGKSEGSYTPSSPGDGVERVISFRKVAGYPFYVQVGWASDDYLAASLSEAMDIALLVASFMLLTLAAAWLIYLSWRHQRQINRALAENQTRLSELFENMSSGVAVYRVEDDGRRFVFGAFNRAAERIEQRSRSEVIGRDVAEAFPGIGALGLQEVFRRVWQSGQSERFPVSFYRDGRITGWRDNFVYKLPSGEIVAIYDDVTERMQAQQALEELNRDFVTLLESTSDFIYFKDRDSRIRFCSQSMAVITGHPGWRDMIGKHDLEIFPPETAKIYYEEELPVFRDGVPLLNKTDPYIDAAGNRCWVNTNKWPVFDADGKTVVGLFGISRDITERVRAEEALRQSEELFRAITDTSPLAIYMSSGIEQRAGYVNPTFVKLFGYSMEEVPTVAEWWPRAYPDENYRSEVAEEWQRRAAYAIEHQTAIEPMETVVTCKDGAKKNISWGFVSVGEQNWAFGLDLTESKQAEQAVRLSMEKLNEAQRIAQVGNWELDLIGGRLFWSDEIFSLFEIDKTQFGASYEAFLNAIHPEDREMVNLAYTHSLETREPYEISHRLQMADGRIKWVIERCETFYGEQGKAMRSVGTVQDITDRKLIEDALRRSESTMFTIMENVSAFIYLKDIEGRYLFANRKVLDLWGATREDVIGYTDEKFFDAQTAVKIRQVDNEVLQAGRVTQCEETNTVAATGKTTTYLSVKLPLRREDGSIYALCGISTDITERIESERRLREKSLDLQQSNSDLERFAYSVSHDMRQPLRAVSGHLQLLARSMKDKLDDDERENMNFALEGAKRMDSMIVSLLDYSRVGRKTGVKALIPARTALDEALGFLEPMIRDTSAAVNVAGVWPQVYASRDELTRLFQNLVGNGIKFCEPGKTPRVEVDSAIGDSQWRVTVRDNGIGIDSSQIDRLFQFFSRLQARSRFEGTGMGLALCRRIVEHHGGKIWVESEGEGMGSTFVFEVPLKVEAEEE